MGKSLLQLALEREGPEAVVTLLGGAEPCWDLIARPEQLAPGTLGSVPGLDPNWDTWLVLAGRGFGKTRTGAEWVTRRVLDGARWVSLVGRTAADVRDVMVEGESGLLSVAPAGFRPIYEPSKRRVTWPNGAIATTYSAEKPDQQRGPQSDTGWGDELAAWKYPDAWDQMQFGNRLGLNPRVCVTTTPRPTPIIRELVEDPGTEITGGSTYENFANLAPKFLRRILARYEGTRLGRQELLAQVLSDTEGALWTRKMIEDAFVRPEDVPEMVRVVVGVDPAVSYQEEDDIDRETKPGAETGIVVVGLGRNKHLYVWADYSGRRAPNAWAEKVAAAYEEFHCGKVVAEGNQGGNLVENILKTAHRGMQVKMVNARVGKSARAEPVSALYEQRKVHHVGAFPELEDQLTSWVPGESDSPDRLDALVWAITFLALGPSGEGYNGRTIVHPANWAGRIR